MNQIATNNNQMETPQEVQPKILILDDNPVNGMLLEKMLSISGYSNVVTLTDSREVFEVYQSFKPDLLLLDLQMPHYDGFEVLEGLNRLKDSDYLPVIIITAQSDKENLLKALELGAKDFVGKPFDRAEVLMRIRNMLEIRMLHNQIREQNQKLEEKVQERTRELQDLQLELVQRLLRAAEFRDTDTGEHIKRIGLYAYEMGREAGCDEKYCKLLEHASMMHDIGKIGIPDEILLKPARLDPEEWAKMTTHTSKGAEILSGSHYDLILMAEQIALTHHEKWDGSGYPKGLKGEEIPIAGRITAICDVFDALISKRPYKEPWETARAVAEIKKGAGTQFDPQLVEIFLTQVERLLEIKRQLE